MRKLHDRVSVSQGAAILVMCVGLCALPVYAEDNTQTDKKRWLFSGYLSVLSANGGPISSGVVGSLGIKRFDGDYTYALDADIHRYSERVLVRRDTGLEPQANDGVLASDPDGLAYTVRNLSGSTGFALAIHRQTKKRAYWLVKHRQSTDETINLDTMERTTFGVGYPIRSEENEELSVELELGMRRIEQSSEENIDDTVRIASLNYRVTLGQRSDMTTSAAYEYGKDFEFFRVKFGIHFWITEQLAFALVNETRSYSNWLERPDYIDGGSVSMTSFNMVFRRSAL